jgi:hypothetical protein
MCMCPEGIITSQLLCIVSTTTSAGRVCRHPGALQPGSSSSSDRCRRQCSSSRCTTARQGLPEVAAHTAGAQHCHICTADTPAWRRLAQPHDVGSLAGSTLRWITGTVCTHEGGTCGSLCLMQFALTIYQQLFNIDCQCTHRLSLAHIGCQCTHRLSMHT